MQAIDVHCHFFPQPFLDEARKPGNPFSASIEIQPDGQEYLICEGDFRHPLTPDFYDAETMIADLDKRTLTSAVISAAPPTLSYWADADATQELASAINEDIARRVKQHPERFTGLGALPLQHMDASIAEATRAVRKLKLAGFQIGSNVNGMNLDDPYFEPLFATFTELDVPVFIHPYIPAGAERMRRYYLHNLIGMVSETALAIASVVYGGLLERWPTLKLCFAHAGGSYPYIQGRLDHGYAVRQKECTEAIPHPPSHYLGKLYFDAISFDPRALRLLADMVGSDHLVVGSDYPFDMGPAQPVDAIINDPYLSEEEKVNITSRTAAALFNVPETINS